MRLILFNAENGYTRYVNYPLLPFFYKTFELKWYCIVIKIFKLIHFKPTHRKNKSGYEFHMGFWYHLVFPIFFLLFLN